MPVIQVFAPPVDDVDARLRELCTLASQALGLLAEDVVATWIPVGATVVPGVEGASWPVVVLHGSQRDPEQMEQARAQVEASVCRWNGHDGSAWVTWQVRT